MNRLCIEYLPLLCFGTACILLYLAGMSFGGPLAFLFYALVSGLFVSVLVFVVNLLCLRFFESFGTEHPVKGEKIEYRLALANEAVIPLPRLTLSFRTSSGAKEAMVPDEHFYLKRNEVVEERKFVSCPFRGIYEVGLDSACVTDLFGFFRFYPAVFFRTFYVYPRLVDLGTLVFEDRIEAAFQGVRRGLSDIKEDVDYVDAYRHGDSMRDICWKRFFVTGEPLVRRYEHSAKKMIDLYLDLRPAGELNPLGEEDLSLEILLSLQKYFLRNRIEFRSSGGERVLLESSSGEEGFRRFYESTIFLRFCALLPPAQGIAEIPCAGTGGSLVVVTHLIDYGTLELLAGGGVLIFNTGGKASSDLSAVNSYGDCARRRGILFFEIASADDIAGVLG